MGSRGLAKVGADMDLDDRLDGRLPVQANVEITPPDTTLDLCSNTPVQRDRTVAEAIAAADRRDVAAADRDRAARARDEDAVVRDRVALGHRDAGVPHDAHADREASARDRQASRNDRHFAAVDRDDAAGDRALLHKRN
jgi:hypothetical protein